MSKNVTLHRFIITYMTIRFQIYSEAWPVTYMSQTRLQSMTFSVPTCDVGTTPLGNQVTY